MTDIPILKPITLEEAEGRDNVIYFVTSVDRFGNIYSDVRSEINVLGGVCDCCTTDISVKKACASAEYHVRAFEYIWHVGAEASVLQENWRVAKETWEREQAAVRAAAREAARLKGTPVLDHLLAKKRARETTRKEEK